MIKIHDLRICIKIFLLLIILINFQTGCSSPGHTNSLVTIAEIDKSKHPHSTTRQFQRMVFFEQDNWHIFYADGKNCCYRSSKDGVIWNDKIVMDEGFGSSSQIDVIYRDNVFYFFNSLNDELYPKSCEVLFGTKCIFQNNTLTCGERYRVFNDIGRDECIFYSSVSMDTDGILWAASRHLKMPEKKWNSVITSRTIEPYNIKKWTPRVRGFKVIDNKSLGSQIIGLGKGRAFLLGKATDHRKFYANVFTNGNWLEDDIIFGNSSKVWGDDKRMSMVFEQGNSSRPDRVHAIYIDDKDHVRYRIFSDPYGIEDWSPPLDQPGELVVQDSMGRPINTFSCVLAIDRSKKPAWLYLLYGMSAYQGKDSRHSMGELRLIRCDDNGWSHNSILMSEKGTKYNWYPNMSESAENKIGILYMKNRKAKFKIMFSSVDKADADQFFDQSNSLQDK